MKNLLSLQPVTKMQNIMATITLSYNGRNKTAQTVIQIIESLGIFKVLKDDEPNDVTVKAIKDVKAGKVKHYKDFDEFKERMYAL